ncbi:helix-turn-helix domain-containing protein, partial [Kineococcus glutinatus]|uniref:helix-turn-helix domain-containing protein n=1 Tax=Kineococcus glutinatus TaxID=1070872 RepID=UPI0031F004F0
VAATLPRTARGPRTLPAAAVDVAAARLGEVGAQLVEEVLPGLGALPAPERARLLEVAAAYVATGSVGGAAAASYCHRNTVLNRLRRLQEVTGLDLAVPAQGAALLLALAVRRAGAEERGGADGHGIPAGLGRWPS